MSACVCVHDVLYVYMCMYIHGLFQLVCVSLTHLYRRKCCQYGTGKMHVAPGVEEVAENTDHKDIID